MLYLYIMALDFLFDHRQENCVMIIKLARGTANKIKNANSSSKWINCNCCSACLNSNASTNLILHSLSLFFFPVISFVILAASHYLLLCNRQHHRVYLLCSNSCSARSTQHHFSEKTLCLFSYF